MGWEKQRWWTWKEWASLLEQAFGSQTGTFGWEMNQNDVLLLALLWALREPVFCVTKSAIFYWCLRKKKKKKKVGILRSSYYITYSVILERAKVSDTSLTSDTSYFRWSQYSSRSLLLFLTLLIPGK